MADRPGGVRHVVAGLPALRVAACALLWVVAASPWLVPVDLPLRAIAPAAAAAAAVHSVAALIRANVHRVPAWLRAGALAVDVVLLTGLLDLTGGPFNPFVVMYAAYVWLALVAVSPAAGVLVAAVSGAGFAWLVVDYVTASAEAHHRLNDFPTHLVAMWISGMVVAELAAHYVARARAALDERQRQVDEARERARRSEHLAALTTLAAGAAHELSTPLATIAVAARELERAAGELPDTDPSGASIKNDAKLIRSEVDRCQVILDGMSGRAPQGSAATVGPLPVAALVDLVRSRLPESQQQRLDVAIAPDTGVPAAAGAAMVQALAALVRNAFDASEPDGEVRLRLLARGSMVRVEVHDGGTGMSPEVQRRAGEPFYTTKPPGAGMGLGLFLARALAEQAGGSLWFEAGAGTCAVLEVPAAGGGAGR